MAADNSFFHQWNRFVHRDGLSQGCLCLFVILGGTFLAGCWSSSNDINRYPIDGIVTFEGKSVPVGEILFEPDAARGNRGPASSGTIKDSQFSITAKRGIIGGPYLVRITGYSGRATDNGADVSMGEPLFPEQVLSIDLPAKSSTRTFELPEKR